MCKYAPTGGDAFDGIRDLFEHPTFRMLAEDNLRIGKSGINAEIILDDCGYTLVSIEYGMLYMLRDHSGKWEEAAIAEEKEYADFLEKSGMHRAIYTIIPGVGSGLPVFVR